MPPKRKKPIQRAITRKKSLRISTNNGKETETSTDSPIKIEYNNTPESEVYSKISWRRNPRKKSPNKVLKCCQCDQTFKVKKNLLVHIYQEHNTAATNRVHCHQCNAVCPNKEILQKHISKRHGDLPENNPMDDFAMPKVLKYNCVACKKKFAFKKRYLAHMRDNHSTVPGCVPCDKCSIVCPNKKVLEEHMLKIHDREVFECPNCQTKFARRSHVLRHMAQTGCDGKGASVFPCEICNAQFSRKDNLIVHLRLQHIMKNAFQCKRCEYHTKNFSKLIIHTQRHHTDGKLQLECDHCGKITGSRAAMTKHLEIHGEKKYECDVCGYKTFTVEVMRRHILTHVSNKPYKCTICGNSYIQRSQLQHHLLKHNSSKCSHCGETFKNRITLLIHENSHMSLKKLSCHFSDCPYSSKEFPTKGALQVHLKTHAKLKPFKCEVCNKCFHSEMNIRRHMETHTLDKPRRCMYCVNARAYVRGAQLVKHVRKQHADVFRLHLKHVRQVLGSHLGERVSKSELDSVLNLLDAESDRILEGCSGEPVFYAGMQEVLDDSEVDPKLNNRDVKKENSPLMTEQELIENLGKLLSQMIDQDTLKCFGWPQEEVDVVLEKVIEQCGARPAERDRWTRVQRLRENTKRLFLYVIEDKNIARMLDTHTIDQIVNHILEKVSE